MLRKIRITLAFVFFVCVTLLFLDFTGTMHLWLGWMAKLQFLPAVLALNFGVIILLIALTLLFGRVYCSVICPLGVFQDIVSWVRGRKKKARYRFTHSPAVTWLRLLMLGALAGAIAAGIGSFVALIAPYSAYGRIASSFFAPLWAWGNNLLAMIAERVDSYAFYETEVWLKSIPVMVVAGATLVLVVVLAWRNGRTYCNTICPVGTMLGYLAKYSLYRPVIDAQKCNSCGLCARGCKSSCIDSKNHTIDYTRCVACMDCLENCKQGAISYTRRRKTVATENAAPDTSRRSFMFGAAAVLGAAAVKAEEKTVDGGLAVILDKKVPDRTTPIVPAGAKSLNNMASHCTGCQLCVSVCPNGVLRPSSDMRTIMQPEMSYERGYCRPECTKCSEVCPAGAIVEITKEEKSSIQIGHAVWVKENCVVLTDDVECGNCARHCPAGAITMVPSDPANPNSRKIPVVNTERCIGCGACENLCPSRPFSAIYVEGHEVHRTI